jgi:hypothetical protein
MHWLDALVALANRAWDAFVAWMAYEAGRNKERSSSNAAAAANAIDRARADEAVDRMSDDDVSNELRRDWTRPADKRL